MQRNATSPVKPEPRVGLLLLLIAAILSFSAPAAAQDGEKKTLVITGSDTMNLMSTALAEAFKAHHPEVSVTVTGGGSGRGIADLMSGLNDVAQASRPMTDGEKEKARANGLDPQEFVVGLDALAVIVNESSPVKELTKAQIAAIFTGAVDNWSAFGGPDRKITVFARESNSGTYHFFKEHVLQNKDFAQGTSYLAATAAIGDAVAKNEGAVGFGGIGYFAHTEGIRILAVSPKKGEPAVSPIDEATRHPRYETIQSGEYPVSRPLHYYTSRQPAGVAKAFLDFVASEEGQEVIKKSEYIPLGKGGAAAAKAVAE
ncbi:MAG: PstS family phosphate ABC transporter substrate-binding protein [Candidatus Sumerlaeia bacterium]|nr:PstS family phosphate ABC transporter substrate-binding protein [Candidatus Sumerlaeia bacterium]